MATPQTLKTKRRRLFFDIETSPNIGLFWEAGYKKNIDYSNIIQERAIICICYKWEDEKEVYSLQWDSKQNDKTMLTKFIEVANLATEMVGHNGDKFDLAWIRTRCLFHHIPMFPKYLTIDTLKVARQKFRFNSNRLNYIADFLGLGQKIKTEYSLWKDILLHKDKVAMEKIEAVGLNGFENQFPNQLSGGMQQRVGLARALATNSDIMLMDEAFSALDPLIRSDMQKHLIDLQSELKKSIV